ncbi:radical SAM family heme chaperone HemW [Fervidicella metallireducens]|nr:radical SAM family heme chaperone HemW [Fervidicella metallireducens]
MNSLYVHIPFCIKKCLYCDFNSNSDLNLQDAYVEALIKEIRSLDYDEFNTIFVGGGTPTILNLKNMEKLLKELMKFNSKEFTFEANPGTITGDKIKLLKEFGVNRISMGLQAWQDRLLKKLGRVHDLNDFLFSYDLIRKEQFNNVNIDLMFAIPEQSVEDWIETVDNVLKIKPEHISCYSLIIEEGTPFYKMEMEGELKVVDESDERQMYYYSVSKLNSNGLNQYEISNFSMNGYECKHNITYWKNKEYIGVGSGAHSYENGFRYFNIRKTDGYIKAMANGSAVEERIKITKNDEISEYMFLGLRMIEGINKKDFEERFNLKVEDIFQKEIIKLERQNLIINDKSSIKLTPKGIDLSNQVFLHFLME